VLLVGARLISRKAFEMPVTAGLVQYVKVGSDYGFVQVRENVSNELETFIIWFFEAGAGGPVGFWTLQLMAALANRLPVEISHTTESAYVTQVKVRTASP
jgi:hypothetical protein